MKRLNTKIGLIWFFFFISICIITFIDQLVKTQNLHECFDLYFFSTFSFSILFLFTLGPKDFHKIFQIVIISLVGIFFIIMNSANTLTGNIIIVFCIFLSDRYNILRKYKIVKIIAISILMISALIFSIRFFSHDIHIASVIVNLVLFNIFFYLNLYFVFETNIKQLLFYIKTKLQKQKIDTDYQKLERIIDDLKISLKKSNHQVTILTYTIQQLSQLNNNRCHKVVLDFKDEINSLIEGLSKSIESIEKKQK